MVVGQFLHENEKVSSVIPVIEPGASIDYDIHVLERPDLRDNDEVILEVRSRSEAVILIGGNSLKLKTLSGMGRIASIDLMTGERKDVEMTRGVELEIPPTNTMYWYENDGEEPLLIRDHCDNFDPAHEPRVSEVVDVLVRTLHGKTD